MNCNWMKHSFDQSNTINTGDDLKYPEQYMTGSMLIASQLSIKDCHTFIGYPTIADAV